MAKQEVQAQKTFWVRANIEAQTETEALELVDAFDIDWQEVEDSERFTGAFWTEETGVLYDPVSEVPRLRAIIKRLKDEFDILEQDWMN
jgi:hypothetical protein